MTTYHPGDKKVAIISALENALAHKRRIRIRDLASQVGCTRVHVQIIANRCNLSHAIEYGHRPDCPCSACYGRRLAQKKPRHVAGAVRVYCHGRKSAQCREHDGGEVEDAVGHERPSN